MNKQQLLMDISLEVDTFNAHLKRLSKSGYPLHTLDVDFLQEKIRLIYERILDLEQFVEVKKKITEQQTSGDEQKITVAKQEKSFLHDRSNGDNNGDMKPLETVSGTAEFTDKEPVNEDKVQKENDAGVFETERDDKNTSYRAEQDQVSEKQHESPKVVKTTLDLFSDMSSETLSDKISKGEDDLSVADRLQKSQIGDLREAIGINEKFQFINELFNGDLTRYNKAIDELNSFAGLEGAKTYLFELSVENQWNDDLPAFLKLKELLERKFS